MCQQERTQTDSAANRAGGAEVRSRIVALSINGERYEVAVKPRNTLLEVIRDTVGLTGTKGSCQQGSCGACTVLISGRPVLACLTLALDCERKEIRTVEDLARGGKLDALQEAFLDQ